MITPLANTSLSSGLLPALPIIMLNDEWYHLMPNVILDVECLTHLEVEEDWDYNAYLKVFFGNSKDRHP